MLRPNKFTNMEINNLALSAKLLKILKSERTRSYQNIVDDLVKEYGDSELKGEELKTEVNIACKGMINFLFLFGVIEYDSETELFEYTGEFDNEE